MIREGWLTLPFTSEADPEILDALSTAFIELIEARVIEQQQREAEAARAKHHSRLTRPGWEVAE